MSADTVIQWCAATVNFWWGCTKVSPGCRLCYAEKMAKFLSQGRATWGPDGLRWLRVGEAASELLRLEKRAVKEGRRLRVFVNSMSDTFEDRPDLDAARDVLFSSAWCVPHLDLLLLTKRPECVETLVPSAYKLNRPRENLAWPSNVWLGFTAEHQASFDARWPIVQNLARRYNIPGVFCSAEPLLGPLDLSTAQYTAGGDNEPECRPLDWLIVGGESGGRAKVTPCDLDWIRDAITQAREFEIPIFVKQLGRLPIDTRLDSSGAVGMPKRIIEPLKLNDSHGGDMAEWPESLRVREFPIPF